MEDEMPFTSQMPYIQRPVLFCVSVPSVDLDPQIFPSRTVSHGLPWRM